MLSIYTKYLKIRLRRCKQPPFEEPGGCSAIQKKHHFLQTIWLNLCWRRYLRITIFTKANCHMASLSKPDYPRSLHPINGFHSGNSGISPTEKFWAGYVISIDMSPFEQASDSANSPIQSYAYLIILYLIPLIIFLSLPMEQSFQFYF